MLKDKSIVLHDSRECTCDQLLNLTPIGMKPKKVPSWKDILREEEVFEKVMKHYWQVKKDGLVDLNLVTKEDPKVIRVSAKLED